jgi:hypothetical protein
MAMPAWLGNFLKVSRRDSKRSQDFAKYFVGGTRNDRAYIWEDRVAAEGYLTPAWSDRMANSYGTVPEVTHFDVRCVVDNTTGEIQFPE